MFSVKTIHRDLFAESVGKAFDGYLQKLDSNDWNSNLWFKARRKIWWLDGIELVFSQDSWNCAFIGELKPTEDPVVTISWVAD